MAPSFYAEYLPNIKSVTITLSNVEPGSSYGLTSPGTDLRIVSPKGEAATIPLPATCNASRSAGMRVSQDPTRAEQTVVRVSAEPFSTSFTRQTGADEEPLVPWSASQLHARIEVSCKACSAVAVKQGKITTWKDLPSEGWAEMMDLWHCHKPDEHDHGGGVDAKGYAAGSKLVARRGVGLVDALGFLIKAEDCVNLEVSLVLVLLLFFFAPLRFPPLYQGVISLSSLRLVSHNFPVLSAPGKQEGVLPDEQSPNL